MHSHFSVIQVGEVLLSADLFTEQFCCDLDACKGACCIEGDAGAPLTLEEVAHLEAVLPHCEADMSHAARRVVAKQGVAYLDADADLVTSIVRGKDCVFTYYDKNRCCLCATEKAYREGRTSWCKPISCYLYPIREKRLSNGMIALNYHRWDVCAPAVKKGRALGLPLWRFLKDPLIKRFGQAWYRELEAVAAELEAQGLI
ncbi:MAG: DUF3109 family protein [Bacteroidales bacterium]|nr:DUF3109 family protein [Bacteroidales bacterium]